MIRGRGAAGLAAVVMMAILGLGAGAGLARDNGDASKPHGDDLAPRELAEAMELGPPVGSPITRAVFGADHTGAFKDFDDLAGPRGLVLVFVRSVDWCPICQIETMQVAERHADFRVREVGLAFVSHDSPEDAAEFVAAELTDATPLLAAKNDDLIERLSLVDPTFPETNRYYGAAFPTALIIDAEGIVRAKLFLEAPPADYYGTGQSLTAAGYDWQAQIDEVLALVDAAFWPDEDGNRDG